jgi:hypothetical protein
MRPTALGPDSPTQYGARNPSGLASQAMCGALRPLLLWTKQLRCQTGSRNGMDFCLPNPFQGEPSKAGSVGVHHNGEDASLWCQLTHVVASAPAHSMICHASLEKYPSAIAPDSPSRRSAQGRL